MKVKAAQLLIINASSGILQEFSSQKQNNDNAEQRFA